MITDVLLLCSLCITSCISALLEFLFSHPLASPPLPFPLSFAARAQIQRMNPDLVGRVHAHANRVAPETQDIYDDHFWSAVDGVCTALDNVQVRLPCIHRG